MGNGIVCPAARTFLFELYGLYQNNPAASMGAVALGFYCVGLHGDTASMPSLWKEGAYSMTKVKVWVLSWAGHVQLNRKDVPYVYKTRAKARAQRTYEDKVHRAVLIVDLASGSSRS